MPQKKHFLDNSAEYFHTLHLVFYLMVSVPLILFCIVYLRRMEQGGLDTNIAFGWLHTLITLGIILCGIMAYHTYRQRFRRYDPAASFRHRLRFFHRTAWLKYVWLGITNLLPVIGLYLSGEPFFVALYAVALILFSINRPTINRVTNDLRLSAAERERLSGDQDFNSNDA